MRYGILMALAACNGAGTEANDFDAVDVVITPNQPARAWLHYVAYARGGQFAQVGACAESETDTVVLASSCLDSLSIDSTRFVGEGEAYGGPGNPFVGPVAATGSKLQLVGCGASIEVPLHVGGEPAIANLTQSRTESGLHVTWEASSADSVLVGIGTGYGTYTCHTANMTSVDFPNADGSFQASAFAFRAPEVTDSPIGPVRIWYGGFATALVR